MPQLFIGWLYMSHLIEYKPLKSRRAVTPLFLREVAAYSRGCPFLDLSLYPSARVVSSHTSSGSAMTLFWPTGH